jgi:F0F1-type ATP synthase membrane subunit b/b'
VPNEYAYADAVANHLERLRRELREEIRVAGMDANAASAKGDNEERAARTRHIEDVTRDLRAEFRREVIELREEVGELVAELHKLIERERIVRADDDLALVRIMDERTADRV